ncbi:FRG domain-containing protein [Cellulomonas sp. NPDC057328]|uniref:FRG domain-containing protein n=1 Tax=Cellulomonas sp. NPDC057328 TaxID=3346101 RepID=UPI00363BA876
MQVLGRIGVYSRGQQFAWRGMSSADFSVTSSLQRRLGRRATEASLRAAERAIVERARQWGLGVGEFGQVDDLQLLADLQHYGIPTRLIDFTSNPMTALWFACQSAPERDLDDGRRLARSGVVLALNVTRFRRFDTVGVPFGLWDDGTLRLGSEWRIDLALTTNEPFIVEQSTPNARLRAQEGFFVAGAVPERSLRHLAHNEPFMGLEIGGGRGNPQELTRRLLADPERGAPRPLPFVAIFIGSTLKKKLLAYLQGSYNRHARALFPDYQGFREYGLPQWEELGASADASDSGE